MGAGRQKSASRRREALLGFERLEHRRLLASFTDSAPTLTLTLAANEAVSIVANASTYTLTLTSPTNATWGGTDDGNVTSNNGTNTLTVLKPSAFTQINLTDVGAGTSVAFGDSGTNSYASNFNVTLSDPAAGSIAFNGATSFTGSNALIASTSDYIVANSGSSITTNSGGITLSSNQQATPTSGTFVGININDATVKSTTGAVKLAGTGGNTGGNNYGVEIQAGGTVKETGASPALLSISGSSDDGSSAAVAFNNGAVSSTGDVSLKSTGGNITEVAANAGADVSGATVTLTTTGSGDQIGTAPPQNGSGTPLKVNASKLLNATTKDGFITLANTIGTMPLGVLKAGAALIELTAVGAITDGNNGTGSANLSAADGATLTTTGSNSAIGTSGNPIRTAIGTLTAKTYDGGVYISDSNGPGLIINSILAQQGGSPPVVNGNNQIVINNGSSSSPGTYNVSVTATGPIEFASSSTVSTTVLAPNAVTINSTGGDIVEGQSGSNNILAQSATLTASGSIGATGTPLAVSPIGLTVQRFSASTTNGGIFLAELIPGTATSVVAGGTGSNVSVSGSGATLGIGTITATTGTVTLQETGGALVNGSSTKVTGLNVSLTGKSGIASSASAFAVTASGSLSATATAPGAAIFVNDSTGLGSVSATTNAGDATITYSGGSLEFKASTALLTASGTATASFDNTGGNVVLGAVKAANITASGAITADSTVSLTGGTVTLTAGTGIGASGSPIKTNVTTLNATTTTGGILIVQAANPLTVSASSNGYSDPSTSTGSDINVQATAGNLTVGTISALGTVTLTSGGAISAPNGTAVSLTADTLNLTAASGIGTSGAVVMTSASTLTAAGGAGGGVFVSNNKKLNLTSASATGGAVSITTIGTLDVGSVTAAGQSVTLSATGALIDSSGPALNVTAQSATLSGSSIGSSSVPFETEVSSLTATGTNGGIYIDDLGTGTVTLTATAAGQGANIDVASAGSIALMTVTAKGNSVTLNAAGSITNGLSSGVNITAQTLSIVANDPTNGGIGTSANPLEILVAQIATADGGPNGVFMNNAGPVSITAGALEAPGSGTLTFDAASITIQDLGTTPVSLAAGRSLLLKTETGPIVFLNQANTIETSGGGTITVEAGTTAGSGGVAVLGNLTTDGGAITVSADGSITIGLLNAGSGNVTVQSANGILLDGNGPSTVNVIAGSTTLSGNAPTARQLQLDEETKIAAAAAANAEAAAEQTSADSTASAKTIIDNEVTTVTATVAADQTTASAADAATAAQQQKVNTDTITSTALGVAAAVAQTAYLIAQGIAGPAQAIPFTGDAGAQTVADVLNVVAVALADAATLANIAVTTDSIKLIELSNASSSADAQLTADQSTLGLAQATQSALSASYAIAEAAAANAQLQSETAQVVANQAIAATDQANVIGSASDPLGIQVTGVTNVTAGPTDSYLQVTGNAAIDQILATGSVTLISTGSITNGAPANTPNVVATGLTITAVNGIGTTATPLLTRVGTLNATNSGSGDIAISNTYGTGAALNITGVSNTGGNVVISNAGNAAAGQGITVTGPISAPAGAVTINSGSPLTIAANVISPGAIVLTAAADTPPVGDNLTVDSGVTVQSTGSSVSLNAGNNIVVQPGSTIEANTSIAITGGASTANVDVEGTLIASTATIGVDSATNNHNTFTITPSASTPITVIGGTANGTNTLDFNADGLPVTIQGSTITAGNDQPVTFSDFAAVNLLNPAGGGSIALVGTAGANDTMVLAGTGTGAGTFTLNGGTPISFSGVNTFAYNGKAQNEAITVSPYATPLLAWGVAVTINGGTGTATLTYNDAAGVSNNVTIQPSATGAGQLIDTNAATGTSVAVVTYLGTHNFVVNGNSGATGVTDNFFINGTDPANSGTSGNDDALANFRAAGDLTHPMVRVYDAGAGAVGGRTPSELNDTAGAAANDLFNLQNLTNFSTIHIGLLGGNDVLDLAGAQTGPLANLAINYAGGTGDDSLIVDSANGPVRGPINYDGGPGTNSMTLTGGSATSDTYTPGSQLGSGTNTLVFLGVSESVSFQNLSPIYDQVAGALTVNGNNANNAITYREGNDTTNSPNAAWGQVSVDNLEPINFTNKTNLTIAGLAGTDTFSLNDPNTPTGLIGIAVSGSGSTGSDALIVNGVGATVGVNTANQTIAGATGTGGAVPVTYNTIGALTVNAGPSTGLAVSNSNSFSYTPGATADAGTVLTDTLPISFTGLGAGKTLALTGSGSGASLVVNDPTANDTLSVASNGNVTLPGRATIATSSLPNLTLNGLNGADTFNVTGPVPYTSTTLAGGGAAVANLNGNGTAVTASLGGAMASVSGGGLGTVALPGIGTLNLNAGAGDMTLAGTSGSDNITVTPTGANTATAQFGTLAPVVNTNNAGRLAVDAGAGSDTLTVNGTTGPDTINVSGSAVAVVGLKPVNYANVESLQVNGLAGSDTFNVTSSATVPISIDGGDPVGIVPGDLLNVVTTPTDTATLYPGPTGDQGGFVVDNYQPISFVHIESMSVSGGGTPVINGTNGNDVIDIVARDGSYSSNLDGVQDFTVSVDGGPNLLFVNTPSLSVNGQAGNNQIVLQAPAPNLAPWNVAVKIDGGVPSVSNQLQVIVPGTAQATFTPAFNGGTLGVTNSGGTISSILLNDIESFVFDGQMGGDTFTMVGSAGANAFTLTPGVNNDAGTLSMDSTLPATFQNLGTGGQLVVNGNGGADSLVDNGTAANDAFTINSSGSGGLVNLNARVPVVTQNIPTLSLEGLAGDDTFTLVPTIATSPYTTLNLDGGATASATGNQANLTAAGSSALSISGQTAMQGGKSVVGTSLQNINLNAAKNDLTVNYVPGVTEAFNVISSPTAGQGQVSIPNVALWSFTNVPVVYVNGNVGTNDTLTFTGTNNSDVYQINLNAAGTDADPVLKLQDSTSNTLLTLGNYTGFGTLNVYGLDGADTFNVYTGPTFSRNLYINGNLPSGKKKLTNVMNVFYVMPRPKIVQSTATQNPSSGLVNLNYGTSTDQITYDGIQNVTIKKQ